MKTTKKWGKMPLAIMAALVLAFGMVLLGCDDGSDDGTSIEGTWKFSENVSSGSFTSTYTFSGSSFTNKDVISSGTISQTRTMNGTFAFDGSALALTIESLSNNLKIVYSVGQTVTMPAVLNGNNLTIAGAAVYTKQ